MKAKWRDPVSGIETDDHGDEGVSWAAHLPGLGDLSGYPDYRDRRILYALFLAAQYLTEMHHELAKVYIEIARGEMKERLRIQSYEREMGEARLEARTRRPRRETG